MSPQKCPFAVGSGPHLIHGSLDPPESAPNGISIGSAVFTQLTRVTNIQYTNRHTDRKTDRHTKLRATLVAIRRIYALRAGETAQYNTRLFNNSSSKVLVSITERQTTSCFTKIGPSRGNDECAAISWSLEGSSIWKRRSHVAVIVIALVKYRAHTTYEHFMSNEQNELLLLPLQLLSFDDDDDAVIYNIILNTTILQEIDDDRPNTDCSNFYGMCTASNCHSELPHPDCDGCIAGPLSRKTFKIQDDGRSP